MRERKRITQSEIDELRNKTTHADIGDLGFEIEENADPAFREDIEAYTKRFAKPSGKDRPCLGCGEFMGGFTWGLAHGHGYCTNCGWPATLYHFIKDRDGKDIATVRGILLQAHPDEISVKAKP
jgi:hypothetical protein